MHDVNAPTNRFVVQAKQTAADVVCVRSTGVIYGDRYFHTTTTSINTNKDYHETTLTLLLQKLRP